MAIRPDEMDEELCNLENLEELRSEREVLKDALEECYTKLCQLNSVKRFDEEVVSERKELCIILEPSLSEIKEVDLKIQAELKRLKLRYELVDELKTSRSYGAKLQVALNKVINLENKFDKESKLSDPHKSDVEKSAERNNSPGFLFSNFPGSNWQSEGEQNERLQNSKTPEPVRMFEPESNPGISDMGHFSGQLNANAQSFRGYNPFGGGMGLNYGNSAYNPLGHQTIKLPKLQLKHFSGDPMKWMEFWESFERNVHCNNAYSDVHKMSYLKACLDGAASTTIANLRIIGENYKPAVDVLKAKYGQRSILKGAHMAALKSIQGVTNSRELNKLRKLYDDIDSHYKALLVLGVQGEHYSVAIVPDLMRKIPWDIVINIRRSKEINHEWTIAEFLEQLWKELVIRSANEVNDQSAFERKREGKLLSVNSTSCVYCLGEHQSKDCTQIVDVNKRKATLRKYKRCFKCLRKGHVVKNCRDRGQCDKCKKSGHHVSICNPEETTVTTTTNLHVTEKGAIAFQTVQARISVPGKPSVQCRMLLDTGSDKTYMLQKVANQLQARPVRYETKILDTVHGSKIHKCAIYDLEVRDMDGKIQFTTEAGTLIQPHLTRNQEIANEEVRPVLQVVETKESKGLSVLLSPEKFSSKNRLIRVTAWIYRFVRNCRSKDRIKTSYLSTAELKRTETAWIKEVQSELETQGNYQQLTQQLNIVKVDEILRCEGRLQFSGLLYDTQIEGLINNRPLTYQTDELEDTPITPNHMIFGYALPTIAGDLSEIIDDDEDYLSMVNKRLKYIATIKANMWRRWTREYIQGLQEYQRHNLEKGKIPEIGEIVLIVDGSIKRRNWRMGKVTELLKSRDRNVRAVRLQLLSHGSVIEIERPLQGVVSLELKGPLKEPVSTLESTSGRQK
eukprot:gene16438-18073_t